MFETIVSTALGVLVSHIYYKRAGDELRVEAQFVHRQTQLILTALEKAGLFELQRNSKNEVIGFKKWIARTHGIPRSGL